MENAQNFPAVIRRGCFARFIIITSNIASLAGKLYHSQSYAARIIDTLYNNIHEYYKYLKFVQVIFILQLSVFMIF